MNKVTVPPPVAESIKRVMGEIDYAPYLPENDNILNVNDYRTNVMQGLLPSWSGNILVMPPPYHSAISAMTRKFVDETIAGNVKNAVILIKAATHTVWFRQLCKYCDAVCLSCGKLMCLIDDSCKLKDIRGLAMFYKGNNADIFRAEFSSYGICLILDHTVYNRLTV